MEQLLPSSFKSIRFNLHEINYIIKLREARLKMVL